MRKLAFRSAAAAASLVVGAFLAGPVLTQSQSGPTVARYTIDAGTMSGMAGMGGGGMGAAMSLLRGGGGSISHELHLRLGSTRAATAAPQADHFIPAGMAMGKSLPLVSPVVTRTDPAQGASMPSGMERPRGRLLLFWGCGERAGPGQPVIIDFSKLAQGQVPPGLYAQQTAIAEEWRVAQAGSKTYGEWPNTKDSKPVPARASLLGAHRVAGNYAPEIAFNLDTDFMAALQVRSAKQPSGAYALNWNAVPGATGHYAWVMSAKDVGGGGSPDMVWWASSATQAFGGPMWDWLSPAAVGKLVAAKTVLPGSQTSCTVPAEVSQAGGEVMMANLAAYGPQRDFSHPARPANARAGWQPEWIARVRFRSNAMVMLGMDMAIGGQGADETSDDSTEATPRKPKCKGLKGIAMRAAGLCE